MKTLYCVKGNDSVNRNVVTLRTMDSNTNESNKPNVVFVGLMGTGKSSVGRQVAENLALKFVDTDNLIIEEAGCSIPEIFDREGEDGFRARETKALTSLGEATGHLIATGGGIVVRPENRVLVKQLGYVVWLTASIKTLVFRVSQNRDRPLMQTSDPGKRMTDLMEARKALYEDVADLKVDTTDLTPPETVHGLIESIHYHFARNQ